MRANLSSRASTPAASSRPWWAELTQNRMVALVLAMVVAVPLLAAPADIQLTGVAAITLEAFALVLMTTLLWRANWDLRPESVRRFFSTSANLPVVLLMGAIALSCALSPFKLFSIQELLRTGSGILLYFVVAYQFRQSKHLSLLVGTLLTLSAIVAIGGMAQYQLFAENRASAIFGNSQPLASFMMLLLPVVAGLAWTDKNPNRRAVALVVGVLMLGCLMLTQGRSAWAGALAGLLMLAYLVKRPLASAPAASKSMPLRARKHQLVAPVLMALIAVGFLVITKTQNAGIDSRVIASANLAGDSSWQSRLQSWNGTLQMVAQKPLTGWGTGLYPVYQREFTGQGAAIAGEGGGIRVSLAEQAHNFYLQTAAELGVPGLLFTLATFVCFLQAGLSRVGHMEAGIRRTLLMGSMAAVVAFMVDALASPSWQYGHTSMFLWLVLGLGTSCLRPRVKREESAPVHTVSRRFSLLSKPLAAASFLVFATLLPTGYSSAQSKNYNGNNRNKDKDKTKKAVYGTAAVGGVLFLLSSLSESLIAGAVGGAVAGGAAAGGAVATGGVAAGGAAAGGSAADGINGGAMGVGGVGDNSDLIPLPTPAPTFKATPTPISPA